MHSDNLIALMESEGVSFSDEERQEAKKLLSHAINEGRIEFIKKDNLPIGFATYAQKPNGIFIEYCFIYKRFRSMGSLLSLRDIFRKMDKVFRWKSRRRGSIRTVR